MGSLADDPVYTFCRYCLASCGLEVTVQDNRVVRISPDKQNPHGWHDFCAKGRTAGEVVDHPRRILAPMHRVDDETGFRYVEASWDDALADIAARCNAVIDAGGPDAVGATTEIRPGTRRRTWSSSTRGWTPSAHTTATPSVRWTRTPCMWWPRQCSAPRS